MADDSAPFGLDPSVFRTQADTRFNSFINPQNPVNMNPGNWGINGAYLTPSYTAPYRPSYSGPYGTQYGSAPLPSFGRSAKALSGLDFSRANPAGDYYSQQAPFYDSFFNKPLDYGVGFSQNFAAPIVSSYLAFKYLNKPSERLASHIGTRAATGFFSGMGMEATKAAAFGSKMGTAMGFVGGMALPAMAAQAGVEIYNNMVDPFVTQRQSADALRRNFAGVTFGESGYGNAVNGRGFSRTAANRLSHDITSMGIKDNTFSMEEVADITDLAGRSGLFDNVKASQFKKRARDVLSQVKLLMEIGTSPDAQNAIETIAKLQQSGLNIGSGMTKFNSSIRSMAAMAGVDPQKMMNTVGMQGQYLFGANGLTPYIGQLAAANSYSSFAAAARTGTLSPALLARMGGTEGATQASLTGQLNVLQTPYARMLGMNAIFGQGISSNAVTNVSRFGAMSASDPVQTLGAMGLYGGNISSMMAKKGPGFIEDMVMSMHGAVPGLVGKNGKMSAEKFYAVLTSMGLSPSEAQAFVAQRYADQDEDVYNQKLKSLLGARKDAQLKFRQNNGLDMAGGALEVAYHGAVGVGKGIKGFGHKALAGANATMAGIADSFELWENQYRFGGDLNDIVIGGEAPKEVSVLNTEKLKQGRILQGTLLGSGLLGMLEGTYREAFTVQGQSKNLDKISQMAKDGDKNAIQFIESIQSGDEAKRTKALYALSKSGQFDVDPENLGKFMSDITKAARTAGVKTEKNPAAAGFSALMQERIGDISAGLSEQFGVKVSNRDTLFLEAAAQKAHDEGSMITATDVKNALGLKKDIDPEDLAKLNDKLLQRSASRGIMDVVSNPLLSKYGSAANMKADLDAQIKNGKGNLIDLLGGLDKAKSYKGMEGVDAAMAAASKGKHLTARYKVYGDMSTEDMQEFAKNMSQSAADQENIQKLYKSGKIDFTTYKQMESESKNSETVMKFDNAVEEFAKAVASFKGVSYTGSSSDPNTALIAKKPDLLSDIVWPKIRNAGSAAYNAVK